MKHDFKTGLQMLILKCKHKIDLLSSDHGYDSQSLIILNTHAFNCTKPYDSIQGKNSKTN